MLLRALLLVSLLLLGACGDPLTKLVNNQFTPIDVEQQKKDAIGSTAAALSKMVAPNVGVGVSLPDAQQVLFDEVLKKQGITKLDIAGDTQLIKIHAVFDRRFGEEDAGDNKSLAAILKTLKPRIGGEITAYAGLAGSFVKAGAKGQELEIRLLPSLSTMKVDKIDLAEKVDATAVGTAIASFLNKYKDNISGELARSPLTRVIVPSSTEQAIDLSKSFKIQSAQGNVTVDVSAEPITVPFKLDGFASLVTSDHVTALVQLSPVENSTPPVDKKVDATYSAINNRFDEYVKKELEVQNASSTNWVAIRKDVLAHAVTSLIGKANACVKVSASVPNQHVSSKISLPNGLGISCSSDRKCGGRQCSFNQTSHDTRNCSRRGFWGSSYNDPFCEFSKAAQNAAYVADANLRKADCDRLRETEQATCEVEKAGEKLLCETKKEALNRLAATGNFANLDVDSALSTDNLQICLRDFSLSTSLDRVQFALEVMGNAKAAVNVKFVPLDIMGHLTCQFPWSKAQTFDASLRDARVGIGSDVQLITDQGTAQVNFKVDKIDVKAKLSPGPTEFLLKSPEILVKCPVLNLAAPTVILLTPFIPVLKGEIDYTLASQSASFKLPMPEQTLANQPVSIVVKATKTSLVATGKLLPVQPVAGK